MHPFEMTPSLLMQYAQMTKNEVFLHMAIKTLAEDGKMKRNMNQICRLLSPTSYLFDEVNFLLRMELRDPKTYASLLHAIASGATRSFCFVTKLHSFSLRHCLKSCAC